jgi:hypothetical protein
MRDGMSKIPGLSEVEVQRCRRIQRVASIPSAAQQRFLSLSVRGDLAVRHQNGDVNSSRNIHP